MCVFVLNKPVFDRKISPGWFLASEGSGSDANLYAVNHQKGVNRQSLLCQFHEFLYEYINYKLAKFIVDISVIGVRFIFHAPTNLRCRMILSLWRKYSFRPGYRCMLLPSSRSVLFFMSRQTCRCRIISLLWRKYSFRHGSRRILLASSRSGVLSALGHESFQLVQWI